MFTFHIANLPRRNYALPGAIAPRPANDSADNALQLASGRIVDQSRTYKDRPTNGRGIAMHIAIRSYTSPTLVLLAFNWEDAARKGRFPRIRIDYHVVPMVGDPAAPDRTSTQSTSKIKDELQG